MSSQDRDTAAGAGAGAGDGAGAVTEAAAPSAASATGVAAVGGAAVHAGADGAPDAAVAAEGHDVGFKVMGPSRIVTPRLDFRRLTRDNGEAVYINAHADREHLKAIPHVVATISTAAGRTVRDATVMRRDAMRCGVVLVGGVVLVVSRACESTRSCPRTGHPHCATTSLGDVHIGAPPHTHP